MRKRPFRQDARNMCGAFVHALNGHESVAASEGARPVQSLTSPCNPKPWQRLLSLRHRDWGFIARSFLDPLPQRP